MQAVIIARGVLKFVVVATTRNFEPGISSLCEVSRQRQAIQIGNHISGRALPKHLL